MDRVPLHMTARTLFTQEEATTATAMRSMVDQLISASASPACSFADPSLAVVLTAAHLLLRHRTDGVFTRTHFSTTIQSLISPEILAHIRGLQICFRCIHHSRIARFCGVSLCITMSAWNLMDAKFLRFYSQISLVLCSTSPTYKI